MSDNTSQEHDPVRAPAHEPWGPIVGLDPIQEYRVLAHEQLLQLIGSRCGRFAPALDLLARRAVDVRSLISQEYAIEEGIEAFQQAAAPSTMKVLLRLS